MRLLYKIGILVFLVFLLFNFKPISYLYSGIEEIRIEHSDDNFSYIYPIYRKTNNESIIIVVGGSGYSSVLGSKAGIFSTGYSTAGILNLKLSDEYDLLVLEKPNLEPFENGEGNESLLQVYTVEDLSVIYAYAIDHYLSLNDYNNVVLLGHSEGGRLVPEIYNKLLFQEKVDKLVISGAGGISQEEQLKILIERRVIEDITLDEFSEKCREIYNKPDSIDLSWWGHPYKRWASFLKYQYIDEIRNIRIPILLFHGSDDRSTPVESARIVFNEHNTNKNISYFEVDGGHGAIFNNLEMLETWLAREDICVIQKIETICKEECVEDQ